MGKIYQALEIAKQVRHSQEADDPIAIFDEDKYSAEQNLIVLSKPGSVVAENFRFLRSRVMRPATGSPPRTVLITSALMGEGKTFVASNLAATISQSLEEHVLVIDTDLRKSEIHKVFGVFNQGQGLSTYLATDTPLSSVLRKTGIDKLTILPGGSDTETPAELLSSEKMKALIREVGSRYPDRFVIIDSPPLELAPETSVLAHVVDAVILVVRYGKTPRRSVRAAMERIRRERLLGVVFNDYGRPLQPRDQSGAYRYRYRHLGKK